MYKRQAFKYYGSLTLVVVPKENQTLDEAKNLLLEQINLVKNGEFPDWIISAIQNDYKLQSLKHFETADGLATVLYGSFINERTWEQELNEIAECENITKEEVVEFARNFFQENYVCIKKEQGVNENLIRVENPGITPIKINRDCLLYTSRCV